MSSRFLKRKETTKIRIQYNDDNRGQNAQVVDQDADLDFKPEKPDGDASEL